MARVSGEGVWKKGRKRSPSPLLHFLALVSFLALPKPRISFLGLSLLRNSTETLATQATISLVDLPTSRSEFYHEREARAVDFLCFLR